MKRPTKFVKPLTDEQRNQLKEVLKSQAPQPRRMRAPAMLLSDRRYAIAQIADISQGDPDRVSEWLEWGEAYQFAGRDDDPRSGRPPPLTEQEPEKAVKLTLTEPRALRQGLAQVATKLGKPISRDTLQRRLEGKDYLWQRRRRRWRSWRDAAELQTAPAELAALRAEALWPTRAVELWSCAEAGVTLQPCIPYAWQKVGTTLALASTDGPRQNILGLLTLHHEFHGFAFQGTIETPTGIPCCALFSEQWLRPALLVSDNAPLHTRQAFEERLDRWQKRNVSVKFLPPYCPELHLIDMLWPKSTYEWLPLDAYQNFKTMTYALFEILKGIGSKYRITFA
jgi:hypothetical protein